MKSVNNKYEMMCIVDAHKAQHEKDDIVKQINDQIVKGGGSVIGSQLWQDKLKITFPIKKKNEGTYYLINFETVGANLNKIKELLRINEGILRFLIIKE